jgi:hypothetical protein
MPDTGGRRKRYARGWTLSSAHDTGQLVRVYCGICCKKRWYLPNDLKQLIGDIEADEIPRHMRCEKCRQKELLVEFQYLTAQERETIRIRRLAQVRMVRRVIWTDED